MSNNTFFILFNWLPAYFHTHWPEAPASIYASAPWSLSLFGCLGSGYLSDMLGKKYNMTFARKFSCSICLGISAFFLYCLSNTSSFYAAIFNSCMVSTQSFSAKETAVLGVHSFGFWFRLNSHQPFRLVSRGEWIPFRNYEHHRGHPR